MLENQASIPEERALRRGEARRYVGLVMNLTHKIVLITGGSRGLGRQMALSLAANGADVVVTYRHGRAEAEAVVAEIESTGRRAAALQLDTAETASFSDFADSLAATLRHRWQRESLDALVNNAGINRPAPFAQTTEEQFDELYQVHFKGVYFLTQRLLPLLADGGSIVNVSTGLARFTLPTYSAYASMKGAIEVFTRYLAKELGPRGIRANTLAPGAIETDFTKETLADDVVRRHIASATALGRVGQPDDIGGVVAFLCSDQSRWVNAQRLEVSGGMNI